MVLEQYCHTLKIIFAVFVLFFFICLIIFFYLPKKKYTDPFSFLLLDSFFSPILPLSLQHVEFVHGSMLPTTLFHNTLPLIFVFLSFSSNWRFNMIDSFLVSSSPQSTDWVLDLSPPSSSKGNSNFEVEQFQSSWCLIYIQIWCSRYINAWKVFDEMCMRDLVFVWWKNPILCDLGRFHNFNVFWHTVGLSWWVSFLVGEDFVQRFYIVWWFSCW